MAFDYSLQPGRVLRKTSYISGFAPLISIVTPFFNAGVHFEQTFRAVMNQTFPWFEWIIVDDGSTVTEDVELLDKLALTDERIHVIHKKNEGVSKARNAGCMQALADIIVPLDADDLMEATYLEYVYWGMYYNPDAAWCYTDSVGFENIEYVWQIPWDTKILKKHNFLSSIAAIRKSDFWEVGGYKTKEQAFFEDWYFWLEMLGKSKKPVHLQEILFWYRRTDTGLLASIETTGEKSAFSQKVIQSICGMVDDTVCAKEYPLVCSEYPEYISKKFTLASEYRVTKKNGEKHILFLADGISSLKKMKSDLQKLSEKKWDFTIILTAYIEAGQRQSILSYTENIFVLADFLDSAYYVDFVSYYIASRAIDEIILCGNGYGRYMIPLLSKYFPHVRIVENGMSEISDESMAELLYKLYRIASDSVRKVEVMEKQKYTFMGKTITSDDPDIEVICAALRQCEEILNRHEEVVNRHEKVVNRHEEVVNRHEEVVNRHEEVINRHEEVVNNDWKWLQSLEERVAILENIQK